MKDPWQDFVYADYHGNPDQILRDLLRPSYLLVSYMLQGLLFDTPKAKERKSVNALQCGVRDVYRGITQDSRK